MAILPSSAIPSASGGGYTIDQSLRFNDNDSAHLSRTPSAGNRKTWTWSGWVKRGNTVSEQVIFGGGTSGSNNGMIRFNSDDTLRFHNYAGGFQWNLTTTALYRDTSSWYNIIAVADTSNGTSGDRVRLYVNGQRITAFGTETYPSQNYDGLINSSIGHTLARYPSASAYQDGYQAEVHFIDGTALAPTSFGETGDYGEWKPIKYTGTYGTNGFYLDFSDSADLGNDVSGEGNDWTVNNLTASDQMLDSPTNNFAVLNGITGSDITLNEGNLTFANNGATDYRAVSTFGMKTGKWYWEMYVNIATTGAGIEIAKSLSDPSSHDRLMDYRQGYQSNGTVNNNLSLTQSGSASSFTTGDIISCTFDLDSSPAVISWYKNDSFQFSLTGTALNGEEWVFMAGFSGTGSLVANFGQDSSFAGNKTSQGNQDGNEIGDFYYEPPTDFLALCTSNLPDPAVIPSEHFNTVLHTGLDNTAQAITGVGFQPDLLWIKGRSHAEGGNLFDAVRGGDKVLQVHTDADEETQASANITAFGADGFTMAADAHQYINYNAHTYVDWCWKAGNETLGTGDFTQGTIASTCSRNVDAGFSIVSYTGTGSAGTVGHGLSKAPEMVIVKPRSFDNNWVVYHTGLSTAEYYILLNSTLAQDPADAVWSSTDPTSNVFSIGDNTNVNTNLGTEIAYCFHSVEGFSKCGKYVGNGSTDGVYVHLGFRPMWIMARRTDSSDNWYIYDSVRDTDGNPLRPVLIADGTNIESNETRFDFLSNGFKLRSSGGSVNASGGTYIYLAFAEQPFKHTNAR